MELKIRLLLEKLTQVISQSGMQHGLSGFYFFARNCSFQVSLAFLMAVHVAYYYSSSLKMIQRSHYLLTF